MNQVETGCKTIFRFDHVIPNHVCDAITQFMINSKGQFKQPNLSVMPWENEDSFDWRNIPSDYLFARIEAFREIVTSLVSLCYNEEVYPHFTDIVLWRAGRSMSKHSDNGHVYNHPLRARIYTVVSYMNDNYKGGETFIKTERGYYTSIPKKGTIVMMKSSEENEHGVNLLRSGIRVTLPIWFTNDRSKIERYRLRE